MKNNYLLPHCFQKIGWGCFILAFMLFFLGLYLFNELRLIPQTYSHYLTLLLRLIMYSSALFVAFSREKEEDEYIMSVRFSSIVIAVYIAFAIFILNSLILSFNASFHFLTVQSLIVLRNFVNPVTMFVLYVAIFKVKLFKIRKAIIGGRDEK